MKGFHCAALSISVYRVIWWMTYDESLKCKGHWCDSLIVSEDIKAIWLTAFIFFDDDKTVTLMPLPFQWWYYDLEQSLLFRLGTIITFQLLCFRYKLFWCKLIVFLWEVSGISINNILYSLYHWPSHWNAFSVLSTLSLGYWHLCLFVFRNFTFSDSFIIKPISDTNGCSDVALPEWVTYKSIAYGFHVWSSTMITKAIERKARVLFSIAGLH